MNVVQTEIPGLILVEPKLFPDERGYFFESYNRRAWEQQFGPGIEFVQDNQSRSVRNVLRGLHYQVAPHGQGKLVRVVSGEIFDVAVDLRQSSPTFGRWLGFELSAENRRQLWIPEGFAHGFMALSEEAEVLYKTTSYYAPDAERTIRWDDSDLAIEWPGDQTPVLSGKDLQGVAFRDAEYFA